MQNLDIKKLIPNYLKNETLTSLTDNLFNRFVSQESSVLVAGTVGKPQTGQSEIQQATLERQENDIVPGLYLAAGKEQSVFTFEDFINKMNVLDIDQANLRSWMAEQAFNFSPPINYDKFINYTNYYWIGKFINGDVMPWNLENEREYYVIQQPRPTDVTAKMPVRLATTRNILRWINDRSVEKITLTFTSNNTFDVTSDIDPVIRSKGSIGQPSFGISTTPGVQTKITLESVNDNFAPSISDPASIGSYYDVMELYITNGAVAFSAGDTIEINFTHFTSLSQIAVNAVNLTGKGTATGVSSLSPLMFIDGVQVKIGDRILVCNQTFRTENGIFVVSSGGQWTRSADGSLNVHFSVGQKIYVKEGTTFGGNTFQVTAKSPGGVQQAPVSVDLSFASVSSTDPSNINEWQSGNYWVHRDDLQLFSSLGIDTNGVLQAQRPIIEYLNGLDLNTATNSVNGNPCANDDVNAVVYVQNKTRFNQLPQFNLYRFDGTHAGKTSAIWFYKENSLFPIDSVLLRRAETTANSDFVFGLGIKDEDDRLLYFKIDDKIESIWQPGVSIARAFPSVFEGTTGIYSTLLQVYNVSAVADNQEWEVTLISPTEASVVGTRSGYVGTVTVIPYAASSPFSQFDDFKIILRAHPSAIPYSVGDKFTFKVQNKVAPRYIKEDADGNIINYPYGIFDSGYEADMATVDPSGAWLTSIRMFQNLQRETRVEVAFADFVNHARSVLRNQAYFKGSSFGNNNSRNIGIDLGLGGQIRDFDSNFPLFASMMIQQDISPISIIDFAEQQYNVALSSIDQFVENELSGWLAGVGDAPLFAVDAINPSDGDDLIDPNNANIESFCTAFQNYRSLDTHLSAMFSDSTCLVKNWPTTLPMLGFLEPTLPTLKQDEELGINVLVHHDGHFSPSAIAAASLYNRLASTVVLRSDGTSSAGIVSETLPPLVINPPDPIEGFLPFANQLWFKPITGKLYIFLVQFDSENIPVANIDGDLWYKRSTNVLSRWDGLSTTWVAVGDRTSTLAWRQFLPERIRDALILNVENKLYESVHVSQQINVDIAADASAVSAQRYNEVELARFAAKYGYNTYAADYVSTDPFTWNYSTADISGVTTVVMGSPVTPARWFDLYRAYFSQNAYGVGDLARPDLNPWRLGTAGFPAAVDKPAGWDAAYASTVIQTSNTTNVDVIVTAPKVYPFVGLGSVDSIPLVAGITTILVVGQVDQTQNGIFTASGSTWIRTGTIVNGLTVTVDKGAINNGTVWVMTAPDPITIGTSNIVFEQFRKWKTQMWADIASAHVGMKLCVDTLNDRILPPYVAPGKPQYMNALLNIIPSTFTVGVTFQGNESYEYGQNGPIENAWKKSIEFLYGQARTSFRINPLKFLDKGWGETYLKNTDNLRVERNSQASLAHKKFLMHGERLWLTNSLSASEVFDRFVINDAPGAGITWNPSFSGKVDFKVTHCASSGDIGPVGSMGPSATVFGVYINGTLVTHVFEGVPFSFDEMGVQYTNITIEDFGIAFEMGDTLSMTFKANEDVVSVVTDDVDFVYGILGCQGCFTEQTPDSTTVVESVEFQPTYAFTAGSSKVLKGLGQWYTNLLRFSYVDTDISTSSLAFRGWDIKLVHRFGALIRPDSLLVRSNAGVIPDTGYEVILKRSTQTQNLWISGLRIQLVQMGDDDATKLAKGNAARIIADAATAANALLSLPPVPSTYDANNCGRKLNASGRLIPVGSGKDWVFRVETYNPAHPIADFNVLDTNGEFTTFNALTKEHTDLDWKRYTQKTSTSTLTMPYEITGVQNVLNFIFGYVSQLEELNFKINAGDMPVTDALTGRNVDWQLEVEKFIDTMYSGVDAGDAVILNPFMDKLFLQTPDGLMGRFNTSKFINAYSTQAAYDITGAVIPVNDLSVVRTDAQTITYSKTPIFSAHIFVDQFEHALLMNERISADPNSEVVFDQFLGQYVSSAYLSFYRQLEINNKPTFDGYVLSGNNVTRNLMSSIDAVQNAYDVNKTFAEPRMAEHAMSLIGFQEKDYFKSLDISPAAQLDFWRGMISAKGTTLSINAFTQYKAFADASVDEFWAYKLAEYGDARECTLPEIKINPNDCFRKFTSLQFYSKDDLGYVPLPLFTQIEAGNDDRWFSIGDLGTKLRFDANKISEVISVSEPGYVILSNVYHNGDLMRQSITPGVGARIVNATTIYVDVPGTYTVSGYVWSNEAKLSPVKLFDYASSTLEEEIGLWHPAAGIHAYKALELVNISAASDPANYNYSTQTTDNPNFMTLKPWNKTELGRVWWDTSKLAYVPYYDATIFPDRESRHSRWGSLAEWASVDLYQWTESDVPPSQYDALAKTQEGDASIDLSVRLSGKVGFKKSYRANRAVTKRAVAWSQAAVADANAHPALNSISDSVYIAANQLIIGNGRLEDALLTPNRRFGGWNTIDNTPSGEVIIGGNIGFLIGASILTPGIIDDELSEQAIVNPASIFSSVDVGDAAIVAEAVGVTFDSIEVVNLPSSSMFGTRIGQILITDFEVATGDVDEPFRYYLRMADSTGFFEDVRVLDWVSNRLVTGDVKNIDFETFGLRIAVAANTLDGTITARVLAAGVSDPLNDVFVREGVNYTEVMPLEDSVYSNVVDTGIAPSSIPLNWRVWDVPSAAQLSADLPAPRNKWRPYLGATRTLNASEITTDVIAEMQSANNTWTLPSGITVSRYASSWSDWAAIEDIRLTAISDGLTSMIFTVDIGDEDVIDTNRLSVYLNGIQLAPAQLFVSGNTVQVVNILPEGTLAYVLYRAYQPTAEQLAFDPSVADDFKSQVWFKNDYQYTKIDVRDNSGNIAGSKYYFWVKDKTVALPDQSMSLAQAKQLLRNGDSTYMIFARMVADGNSQSGGAYDSCAISGLGTTVTKNDSYKLRFLRDFTLRDDPQELKLKNTHTEWALIRERQSTKIPRKLWDALTDSVCGQDVAGNSLPSATRLNYDEKHGTRTRYGFNAGQLFVESELAVRTIVNTILNTGLTIKIGAQSIVDYVTFMNIDSSTTEDSLIAAWFTNPTVSRNTMNRIFNSARASQINEIFFEVLSDALANNYEFTDLFKTSLITVNSVSAVTPQTQIEQQDEFF